MFEKAQIERNNGQIKQAVADYQKVREQALRVGDRRLGAECLHMIGVAYYQDESYREAITSLEKAQKELERLGDEMLVGATLRDLGLVAKAQKNYDQAKRYYQESLDHLQKFPGHLGMTRVKLGKVYLDEEELALAEQTIQKGIVEIAPSPEKFFLSSAYFDLAQVQKRAGKIEEARKSVEKSKEILDEISGPDQNQSRRQEIKDFLKELLSTN